MRHQLNSTGIIQMKLKINLSHAFAILSLLFSFQTFGQPLTDGGGDKGGGGNHLETHPAGMDEIHQGLKTARLELYSFLKHFCQEIPQEDGTCALSQEGPSDTVLKKIIPLIPQFEIEEDLEKPCYDLNGVPKEGSIYGKKDAAGNQAICISNFQLQQARIDVNSIDTHVVSLVAHEYTHLAGYLDEATAVQIENLILYYFQLMGKREYLNSYERIADTSIQLRTKMELLEKGGIPFESMGMFRQLSLIQEGFEQLNALTQYEGNFSFLDRSDKVALEAALVRTNFSLRAVVQLVSKTAETETEYQDPFKQASELSLFEALKMIRNTDEKLTPEEAKPYSFNKVTSFDKLKSQFDLSVAALEAIDLKMKNNLHHFGEH